VARTSGLYCKFSGGWPHDRCHHPIGISRIGQIAINVHHSARATAFYRDVLGLPLLFTAGKLAFF
jgi:catechol-2,3-dioxygenase